MKAQEIHQLNISNLTTLWETMGAVEIVEGLYHTTRWPYRLWLAPGRIGKEFHSLLNQISKSEIHYTIPIWQHDDTLQVTNALARAGYCEAFRQTAMFLKLDTVAISGSSSSILNVVTDEEDVRTWVGINESAFGYEIDIAVIQQLAHHPDAHLVLHRINNQPIAAAMLFFCKNVAGIHLMGVLPEFRREGAAKTVMVELLHHSKFKGFSFCTLQASQSGYGLYKGLGFIESGTICSYQRLL